jgi:D-proline reductase (dithiol) PrdB
MDQLRPYRSFVSYIDRSREYYSAQGYKKPYAWPHYDSVPFTPLRKSLSKCRVGLVTTAGKPKPANPMESMLYLREMYAQPASPPPTSLYTDDLFWDKKATHTKDVDSFFPVNRLAEYAQDGRIGSASPRFYCAPTDYSQARTLERYCPQILEWCREDGLDAVILLAL